MRCIDGMDCASRHMPEPESDIILFLFVSSPPEIFRGEDAAAGTVRSPFFSLDFGKFYPEPGIYAGLGIEAMQGHAEHARTGSAADEAVQPMIIQLAVSLLPDVDEIPY